MGARMILVYDTETTGIPLLRAPSTNPNQPHLVQLAAILFDPSTREKERQMNIIVQPDGWTIPDDVAKIHKITTEIAIQKGEPLCDIVDLFWSFHRCASHVVAFNGAFDRKILRIASIRAGMDRDIIESLESSVVFHDPCKLMTPICNLPPTPKMIAAGFNKPKTPKLMEAYRHLFGRDFQGAHNAFSDVRACSEVFWWLVDNGHIALGGTQ